MLDRFKSIHNSKDKGFVKMYEWKYFITIRTPNENEVFTKYHDTRIGTKLESINFHLLKKLYGGKWWKRRELTFGKKSLQFLFPDVSDKGLRHYHILWYLPIKDKQKLLEYRDLYIKRWRHIHRNNPFYKSLLDEKSSLDDEVSFETKHYPHFQILTDEDRKDKIGYCCKKIDRLKEDENFYLSI